MYSSRRDFNESWVLLEMPMTKGAIGTGLFSTIKDSIGEFVGCGLEPTALGSGYFKIQGQQVAYYWHINASGSIDAAMELSVKPQALVVNGVGKDVVHCEIHASDLYKVVLSDNYKAINLHSDEILSDRGLQIWCRLLRDGHHISVYDVSNPAAGLTTIKTENDLVQFTGRQENFRRFRFVLSDSAIKLAETTSYFNTRRMRELAGLGTD